MSYRHLMAKKDLPSKLLIFLNPFVYYEHIAPNEKQNIHLKKSKLIFFLKHYLKNITYSILLFLYYNLWVKIYFY